ncbi:hypothetical protein BGZ57DRAFT_855275 [Hyaloscypha finlandica]|nr:hypothetical protein BGZ57DRAFT_855275 [Hyaloscypha finlandica]
MPGVASLMVDVGCLASALLVWQRLLLGVQSQPPAWPTFLGKPSNSTILDQEICGTAEFAALTANNFSLGLEAVPFGPKKVLFLVAPLCLHPPSQTLVFPSRQQLV